MCTKCITTFKQIARERKLTMTEVRDFLMNETSWPFEDAERAYEKFKTGYFKEPKVANTNQSK